MKGGSSNLIMGAILVMSVSLVLVLGLVLVLLAELYCSLLLRRRLLRHTTSAAASEEASTANLTQQYDQPASTTAAASLSSFYARGVLRAPRSILFPSVSYKTEDVEKQHSIPVLQFGLKTQKPKSFAGLVSVSTSLPPSPTFIPLAASPKRVEKDHHDQEGSIGGSSNGSGRSNFGEHLVYISNPIYDNEVGLRPSSWVDNTPFETPDTSPSRMETGDTTSSSGDDDDDESEKLSLKSSSPAAAALITPPLTPMKKLPAEGCSVSLRDARSLGTSGSDQEDSNSNNCGVSSSSLATPCTSPSW